MLEKIFKTLIFLFRIILLVKSVIFDTFVKLGSIIFKFPLFCLEFFREVGVVFRDLIRYLGDNYKQVIKKLLVTLFYCTIILVLIAIIWVLTSNCREVATVFFPLFDAIVYAVVLFLYRKNLISRVGIHYFWGLSLSLTVLFGFSLVWNFVQTQQVVSVTSFTWLKTTDFKIDWGFLFDALTINMLFVVLFVSALVKIYSWGYMQQDPHQLRFFSYLSLFTFFMLILVTADNFIQMFVGWEGVGICSYLLISFWSGRVQALKAALKAIILNRIADCFLFLAICLICWHYKSAEYSVIFSLVPVAIEENPFYTNLIALFLLVGAAGKSAQFGLHLWLPDAMEGPTPVSALIHAATMVTAGVFLIVRCSPIFEYSAVLPLMALWGAFTCIYAATVALVQYDLKKIIAYSTCSQLGYMFFACGTSNYQGAMFHLTTHAFFKALLFLAAGAIIHSFADEQDIRKFGGVCQMLPLVYTAFLMGSLALMGFPFFAGYYSKEYILQYAYVRGFYISYAFANLATLFTTLYSLRLIYYVFFNTFEGIPVYNTQGVLVRHNAVYKTNMTKHMLRAFHEPSKYMTVPLILLAFLSIFSGYFLSDLFIGFDSFFFGNSIFVLPEHSVGIAVETEVPVFIKILPLLYIFGSFFCWWLFRFLRRAVYRKKAAGYYFFPFNF
jgi:proton-translocating NADH-quinone oxidoreductase chain L